jgi:hypothetical protein
VTAENMFLNFVTVHRYSTPLIHLCFWHASSLKYTVICGKYDPVLSPPLPTICITFVLTSTEDSFWNTNFTYITKHTYTSTVNLWAGTSVFTRNNENSWKFWVKFKPTMHPQEWQWCTPQFTQYNKNFPSNLNQLHVYKNQ